MVLIGTSEGVYRAPLDEIDSATRVLDIESILRVRRFGDAVFAATRSGLFRSTDRGETWTNLGVPQREVYSVLQSPDGERLYAGTHPAYLYVSTDGGESWRELEGLQDLPSRETWYTPRHRNEAHVRSLGAHSDAPGRIIAGIEVGGVHVSADGGETWTERREGMYDDIHHVLVRGAEEFVAATGDGLYRTRDAGQSWTRLATDFEQTYFRETFVSGERLYAAAADSPPSLWNDGPDAALFESTDGGDTFESVPYPERAEESIRAWTAHDGDVLAGTHGGHVLRRAAGEWTTHGNVPATIVSLCVAGGPDDDY